MELMLAFYPSLVLGVCCYTLAELKKFWHHDILHSAQMYKLGKQHGREEAALEVYKIFLHIKDCPEDKEGAE